MSVINFQDVYEKAAFKIMLLRICFLVELSSPKL